MAVTDPTGGKVIYIKVAKIDANGVDLTSTLDSLSTLVLPFGNTNVTFNILNITSTPNYFLYYVSPQGYNNMMTLTGSLDTGTPSYNSSFISNTSYP